MKSTSVRQGVAELLIGAAVCAGGYFLLVDPVEGQLGQVRQRMAAIRAEMKTETDDGTTPQQAARSLKLSTDRLSLLAQRSKPARDQAVLLGEMMSLASTQRVRIEQLNPVAGRQRSDMPAPAAPAGVTPGATAAPVNDLRVSYAINVAGSFADVVHFVDALTRTVGLTQIRSVRLAPTAEAGATNVLASIETEHFAADLSGTEAKP